MSPAARHERYPVLLDLGGRLVIVVGSTASAQRTAIAMAAHGADVVVVTDQPTGSLLQLEADGVLGVEQRAYAQGDLKEAFVAVAASGSVETDAVVLAEAREAGVPVCVMSDAEKSDFTVPSVVERGALQIAVSTGGGAPSVTREVRRAITAAYGPEWAEYTRLMAELRVHAIERTGLSDAELAPLFAAVDSAEVRRLLVAGRTFTAKELYDQHAGSLRSVG